MAELKTEGLTYTYGIGTPFEKTAVEDVDLTITEGTLAGIIGHTGSGKSTLIQHFNGLLAPTSGRVLLDGMDINADKKRLREIRFRVGLVFQYPEYQLFEDTVMKDISFGPRNMGLSDSEIKTRVFETAEELGISEELLTRSPFELSGGQKRRVAIAGVMAMRPEILILDEPTAGLDPVGREKIFSLIKDYHSRYKCTVLIVSHSMEDVARYAQKLIVMNKGRLFCYDDTAKVFERADEISAMGLSVPQITKVFNMLRENGVDVGEEIYTVHYGAKLLTDYISKHKSQ